ncbi:MAG: DUF4340 domain-containing protein [Hyphomicrobiaceae bacterium]
MNSKHFNILAIAAVVSLVTAGLVHSAYDTWTVETVGGEKLFPSFDRDAKQVSKVSLRKGKQAFTFAKKDDGNWVLSERGDYPVKSEQVRKLLVEIAQAELAEAKTRDPKRYDLLELGDPEKDGATSTRVTLSDKAGKKVGELVVGKRRVSAFGRGKTGSYVRRPGEEQTWLTNGEIRTTMDVSDWVEPVFFKMKLDRFKTLTLEPTGGDPVKVVIDDKKKDNFKFESIPDGKTTKKGIDATVMIKALETLEMTDVRKTPTAKPPKDAQTIPAVLETKDGMKLKFAVLKVGENDRWLSVDVLEDGKKADEAKKLRKALSGWQFKIADWRSRQVFKTAIEMFANKVVKPPAPAGHSSPTGASPALANPAPGNPAKAEPKTQN